MGHIEQMFWELWRRDVAIESFVLYQPFIHSCEACRKEFLKLFSDGRCLSVTPVILCNISIYIIPNKITSIQTKLSIRN